MDLVILYEDKTSFAEINILSTDDSFYCKKIFFLVTKKKKKSLPSDIFFCYKKMNFLDMKKTSNNR